MTKQLKPHLEIVKGRVRWFYRVVASNGQTKLTSEKYF